jgi:hypothetical protein
VVLTETRKARSAAELTGNAVPTEINAAIPGIEKKDLTTKDLKTRSIGIQSEHLLKAMKKINQGRKENSGMLREKRVITRPV